VNTNVIPFPADRKSAIALSVHHVRPNIAAQLVRIFELIDEVEQISEQHPISPFSGDVYNLPSLVTRLRTPLKALASSPPAHLPRSEEHTSELQSRVDISYGDHRDLPSFPTRRSSDLAVLG